MSFELVEAKRDDVVAVKDIIVDHYGVDIINSLDILIYEARRWGEEIIRSANEGD